MCVLVLMCLLVYTTIDKMWPRSVCGTANITHASNVLIDATINMFLSGARTWAVRV